MEHDVRTQTECRYSKRQCRKIALDGYQLCGTHVLDDKDCPFQQCSYMSSKTGRRCVQAVISHQKTDTLCLQHSTKLKRTHRTVAKKETSALDAADKLLNELKECMNSEHITNASDAILDTLLSPSAVSTDESDVEDRHYPSGSFLWQPDSDSESLDSESDDIFKYAEVFTAEEVTRITRDKLIRLQSLYIEQFKWLQNVLRERRRLYLRSMLNSDSTPNEEGKPAPSAPKEESSDCYSKQCMQEYRATARYHTRHGKEALMYSKSQERRRLLCNAPAAESYHHNRYRHASKHGTKYCSIKNIKCHERSLPFTRYCIRHINSDSKQILFRRCGYVAVKDGLACERIVADISKTSHCDYHTCSSSSLDTQLPLPMETNTPDVGLESESISTYEVTNGTADLNVADLNP